MKSPSGSGDPAPRMTRAHVPVLAKEALRYLDPRPGRNYIDATADGGGHAVAIAKAIQPGGKLLAIEWDEELFERLAERIKKECSPFSKNCVLRRASYAEIERLVRSQKFGPVAGVLFDLGMSTFHFAASRRGFSFLGDEPLDMRFSRRDISESAADLIARRSRSDIETMVKTLGGERFAGRIAQAIAKARRVAPIRRTRELVEIVRRATPKAYHRSRTHFATRTFQALRIAVNHEFENITRGLHAAAAMLAPGGRIVVISFHWAEDAVVKHFFRSPDIRARFAPLVASPIRAAALEIAANPGSRSALLRAYEYRL